MKITSIVLLASTLFSGASFAEVPVDTRQLERNKAKIVSRLYQATYGQVERCKKATPDAAAEFQNELSRFVEINGNLIKQVIQSPYYDPARQRFSKHEAVDPVQDTPESLGRECKYLVQLLRSMNDTPEGKKSVKEYEALLSR